MAGDEERRAVRANWPVRRYRLGDEPVDKGDPGWSAEERMALVWQLTVQAWHMAGKEMPSYERAEIPVRIIPTERRTKR